MIRIWRSILYRPKQYNYTFRLSCIKYTLRLLAVTRSHARFCPALKTTWWLVSREFLSQRIISEDNESAESIFEIARKFPNYTFPRWSWNSLWFFCWLVLNSPDSSYLASCCALFEHYSSILCLNLDQSLSVSRALITRHGLWKSLAAIWFFKVPFRCRILRRWSLEPNHEFPSLLALTGVSYFLVGASDSVVAL